MSSKTKKILMSVVVAFLLLGVYTEYKNYKNTQIQKHMTLRITEELKRNALNDIVDFSEPVVVSVGECTVLTIHVKPTFAKETQAVQYLTMATAQKMLLACACEDDDLKKKLKTEKDIQDYEDSLSIDFVCDEKDYTFCVSSMITPNGDVITDSDIKDTVDGVDPSILN